MQAWRRLAEEVVRFGELAGALWTRGSGPVPKPPRGRDEDDDGPAW
jgi:hypothetical protein